MNNGCKKAKEQREIYKVEPTSNYAMHNGYTKTKEQREIYKV